MHDRASLRRALLRALSLMTVGCSDPAPGLRPDVLAGAADVQWFLDATPADAGLDVTFSGGDGRSPDASDDEVRDADSGAAFAPRPVVFVHGINGSTADFTTMISRLEASGWPSGYLRTVPIEDPSWGCNVDNAATIRATVAELRVETGAALVDVVAHSMGALSSRHYVKFLGGVDEVNTYVSLGGLHHGNRAACLNPLPVCVWQELCPTHPFIQALDADPATPGDLYWVSIFSRDDGTVPVEVSRLDGAENIEVTGVPHAGTGGLLEDGGVYTEVLRVLSYPRR
ncbi:MAG: hypothetical protein HYV07_27355 [Deltaproteobacteria bacterium]|nr:hypothetical protein [Deltaproteobacteria bacterium]